MTIHDNTLIFVEWYGKMSKAMKITLEAGKLHTITAKYTFEVFDNPSMKSKACGFLSLDKPVMFLTEPKYVTDSFGNDMFICQVLQDELFGWIIFRGHDSFREWKL